MKRVLRLIFCISVLFISAPADAQQTFKIEGKIVSMEPQANRQVTEGCPLEGANAVLLRSDSSFVKGTQSDRKGGFRLTGIAGGDYLLRLSYVGCETAWISLKDFRRNVKIGKVHLYRNDTELSEVTVEANPVVRQMDRMLVYPPEDIVKTSFDPYDVLEQMMIPRLRVDGMSKTLETEDGSGGVQIRINGLPATQAEMLAIPAKDILRIEVIDSPGMKYGGAGMVVDVIAKRRTGGGLAGIGGSFCPYLLNLSGNYYVKLNHNQSQWGIYYNNGFSKSKGFHSESDEYFELGENHLVHRTQEKDGGESRNDNHSLSLTYNVAIPDNYTLNIAFRNSMGRSPYSRLSGNIGGGDGPAFSRHESNGRTYSPVLDVWFNKKLKRKQEIQLNVVGTYLNSTYRSTYREYENEQKELARIVNDAESDKKSIWGEALYSKSFEKLVLNAGLRHYQMNTHVNYTGTSSYASSLNQMNTSAFLDLVGRVKRVGYTVSMGASRFYLKEGGFTQEYYQFTPTVRAYFAPHKNGWLQLIATTGSNAPALAWMTDVEQWIDTIQIQRGNPNLKAYNTYNSLVSYSFTVKKFTGSLQMGHYYCDDPIMEEYFVENEKLIRTDRNQRSFQNLTMITGLSLRNVKMGKDWAFSASLTGNYLQSWSKGENYSHKFSNYFLRGSLSLNYKTARFFVNYGNRYSYIWGETIWRSPSYVTLGLRYNSRRFYVLGSLGYPFMKNESEVERVNELSPYVTKSYNTYQSNYFTVSFGWNFEFGKKFKERKKDAKFNDTDAGILKER